MANITDATKAYSSALAQIQKANVADDASPNVFSSLVKDSLQSAINMQHKSEQVSGKALAGKADMTDVLQAITDAEMALNTVLAVRDKVVQAYEQVMRTPM